jgi:hypothetical protein
MFEIYVKEVVIETMMGKETLKLQPLSGEEFPKLMKVITKLQPTGEDTKIKLSNIDSETSSNLHAIILATLRQSYPNEDIKKLDMFTTQNLFVLMGPILELNINNKITE